MRLLIQLTETDKRVLFALFIIIILLFVLIGYLGFIVTRVMKRQGQKLDTKVYDVVVTRVINNKKDFKKYARKKNWRMFYKSAQIPVLILLIAGFFVFIHFLVNNFENVSLLDANRGFSSLLFIWDFEHIQKIDFFGMEIISQWPQLYEGIGYPQFVVEAIPSYLAVLGILVGGLWYLYEVQALIARSLRINSLCDSIFEKSLEGFNINNQFVNQMNPQNNAMPQQGVPPMPNNVVPPVQQQPPVQQAPQPQQKEHKFPFWRK